MKQIYIIALLSLFTIVMCSTKYNREKPNDIFTKFHQRRAAGILAQPRVGRTTNIATYTRSDGSAGLVHYPRVGRSDESLFTKITQKDRTQILKQQKYTNRILNSNSLLNFIYRGLVRLEAFHL